jgi:hypothetical protein
VEIQHERHLIAGLELDDHSRYLLIVVLESSYDGCVFDCAGHRGSNTVGGMNTTTEFERCLRAIDDFRRRVAETGPDDLDCRVLERELRAHVEAVGCAVMMEVLERADTKAPQVTINGKEWGNRRESKGTYISTFGEIAMPRSIYSPSGGGPVAVPLDLRLGIVERRYTPQMARVMTRAIAVMTDEEAEGLLAEVGIATVSKSTLHRQPRAMAARYEQKRAQIQEEMRDNDEVPDAAVTVQASLDGVMVPQDGEYARARGRPSETPNAPRHETHYAPVATAVGPAANDSTAGRSWHEGGVGTVSYWDQDGNRLRTLYFGRMPESGKGTLADEVEDELCAGLMRRPDLHVVFAADGDAHQWALLEGMAVRLPETTGEVSYLLDFYHAAEYVQLAANAIEGKDSPEARVLAATWREQLKECEDGPERLLKAMRYYRDRETGVPDRDGLETAIDFLAKQASKGRMAYAAARAQKRPIGTGVTEAAAKTIVGVRMKRAGARFSQHGGQTVMLFRTALLSERFDALSECLEASYKAIVKAA